MEFLPRVNIGFILAPHHLSPYLRVFARPLQYFFLAALVAATSAHAVELRPGNVYQLSFTDVDKQELSTSDGHVTVITVVTREDESKAQTVGDRIAPVYMGNPKYRLINLVNFQQKIFPPFRGMISAIIRYRLDAEAKKLQKIYSEKRIKRAIRAPIFMWWRISTGKLSRNWASRRPRQNSRFSSSTGGAVW